MQWSATGTLSHSGAGAALGTLPELLLAIAEPTNNIVRHDQVDCSAASYDGLVFDPNHVSETPVSSCACRYATYLQSRFRLK